jgi:hypothetical protein
VVPNIKLLLPKESLPFVKVKVPLTIGLLFTPITFKLTPALLLIIKLLNVVAAEPQIDWAVLPFIVTVPDPALKLPLLTKLPLTLIDAPFANVTVALAPI